MGLNLNDLTMKSVLLEQTVNSQNGPFMETLGFFCTRLLSGLHYQNIMSNRYPKETIILIILGWY